MTRMESRLIDLLEQIAGDRPLRAALEQLLQAGAIDYRACERIAISRAVEQAQRAGIPRCEAFEKIAGEFCCSYEKVRNAFYKVLRNR